MNKAIRITFSNGETYDVPATIIAHHRGKYYAFQDTGLKEEDEPTKEWWDIYTRERRFILESDDDYDLMEWAENNINWEDVEDDAIKVEPDPDMHVNKHDEWCNKEKRIVE